MQHQLTLEDFNRHGLTEREFGLWQRVLVTNPKISVEEVIDTLNELLTIEYESTADQREELLAGCTMLRRYSETRDPPIEHLFKRAGPSSAKIPKCIIIGDAGSGKTTFMRRAAGIPVNIEYVSTLGVEVHPICLDTPTGQICVNCWEIAGTALGSCNLRDYAVGADVVIYIHRSDRDFNHDWIDKLGVPHNVPVIDCVNNLFGPMQSTPSIAGVDRVGLNFALQDASILKNLIEMAYRAAA
jgi:hypothetical protein